jgi:hypothetical protein
MKSMSAKHSSPLSARMVEDETAEKLKKRLRDMGFIVNAGDSKAPKPKGAGKLLNKK